MRELRRPTIILATEPGTLTYLRYKGEKDFLFVETLDRLVEKVTYYTLKGYTPVIDSINWHYRESPTLQSSTMLSYISAVLHESGGIVTAQITVGDLPSGHPYIIPWAHFIIETSKIEENLFKVLIKKPIKRIALFRLEEGMIRWL
jgi:hypothetical protein